MTSAINVAQSGSPSVSLGFKNRIINGDMRIDQRNSGASVSLSGAVTGFGVDRLFYFFNSSGTATIQQSTSAPAGFTKSSVFTVGTADASVAAGDYAELEQKIEGYNVADLGFGSASPSTVTLSFWVKSSVTGIYCVNFRNGANNRAYVAQYTINAANIWEQKTVTITGDTSGTWATDTSTGLTVGFALMVGSTFQQASGSWGSTTFGFGSASQTNLMATSGATFYITGVQLEKGTAATSFEYRDYGRELIMCQRYCYVPVVAPSFSLAWVAGAAQFQGGHITHPTPMRTSPTISGVTGFTIQGLTGGAVGLGLVGQPNYIVCGGSNSNGATSGLMWQVSPQQNPIVSAEL